MCRIGSHQLSRQVGLEQCKKCLMLRFRPWMEWMEWMPQVLVMRGWLQRVRQLKEQRRKERQEQRRELQERLKELWMGRLLRYLLLRL